VVEVVLTYNSGLSPTNRSNYIQTSVYYQILIIFFKYT